MANKIILSKKSNGKTAIRLDKDLVQDLKTFATKTEYKNISLQGLVDIAIRRFIHEEEKSKKSKEPN